MIVLLYLSLEEMLSRQRCALYMYMLMWSIFLGALTGMICRSEACFFVYVSSSMLDKTIYLLLNLVSMCRHHLL